MTCMSVVEPLAVYASPDLVAAGRDGDGGAEADASAAHLRAGALTDVRVLLVEDDGDALELLTLALEGRGAKVTACSDARQALAVPGPRRVRRP
jgi:PleD family two-component response regulator